MNAARKYYVDFVLLILLLIATFLLSLCCGSADISFKTIINLITGEETKPVYREIFFNLRLPKAITAVLCGASLSVCGLMMQTLFRNPLAGPYILGVNSGASLFVAILITGTSFLGITKDSLFFSGGIALFASTGAVITLLIILAISFRIKNNITLLLTGIMLGYIYGAVQNILEYFSNPGDLKSFVIWGMGSLGNVTWNDLKLFAPLTLVCGVLSFFLVKPLNLFLLGDNYAQSSGLNIKTTKWKIILLTGILSGISTAYCGPIAFVGLAVPHLARIIFKSGNHFVILPGSALLGAAVLLFCDIAGNFGPGNSLIPINVTTSLLGAPVVIWLLFKNKSISN